MRSKRKREDEEDEQSAGGAAYRTPVEDKSVHLVALDPQTGRLLWTISLGKP